MNGYFSIMGGLAWCSGTIMANIPQHTHRVELTCGRGELVWMLRPPCGVETLNDKDELLIRLHRIVQASAPATMDALGEKDWTVDESKFNEFRRGGIPADDAEFVYRMLMLFAGGKRGDELFKDVFWKDRDGRDLSCVLNKIRYANARFRRVQFTTDDAMQCLLQHCRCPETFVFIDPPYPSRERYYRIHDFPWTAVCDTLDTATCKWMLVSDSTLSTRVGEGKRLGRADVLKYVREAHASLHRLARSYSHVCLREPYRMSQQFSRLRCGDKQKQYLVVANYALSNLPCQGVLALA